MYIVNAAWEKRNLGVDCVEFVISRKDDWSKIKKIILDTTVEYQVAKVPVGEVRAQIEIQECGFKFFETNIQLERKIDTPHAIPSIYSRFAKDVTYRNATENEIKSILEEVSQGKMFITDKVAQDPYFSAEVAGRRYSLWAKDIIANGGTTVLGLYKGKVASFTIYEAKDDYYSAFIGGMLSDYRNRGMGFLPLYVTAEQIYDIGGGVLRTGVSSNNLPILKLQLLFGARITEMTNIYIKHI